MTFSQLRTRNYELGITDVMGKEVYKQTANCSSAPIDISSLSSGLYFYQIRNYKETKLGKFVVER